MEAESSFYRPPSVSSPYLPIPVSPCLAEGSPRFGSGEAGASRRAGLPRHGLIKAGVSLYLCLSGSPHPPISSSPYLCLPRFRFSVSRYHHFFLLTRTRYCVTLCVDKCVSLK